MALVRMACLGMATLRTALMCWFPLAKGLEILWTSNLEADSIVQSSHLGRSCVLERKTVGDWEMAFFLQKFFLYLSDITVVNSSGVRIPVKEVFLYKWGADEFIQVSIPAGIYDSLVFGLGLSESLNNSNPNAFPDNHPLSMAQDMFWPMLKYRFVVMEGAVDTTLSKTGVVNFPLTYHLGADDLYRTISRAFTFTVEEGENRTVNIPVELNSIFDGPGGTIDMRTHFSNHSTDMEKAAIMINNLATQME